MSQCVPGCGHIFETLVSKFQFQYLISKMPNNAVQIEKQVNFHKLGL